MNADMPRVVTDDAAEEGVTEDLTHVTEDVTRDDLEVLSF